MSEERGPGTEYEYPDFQVLMGLSSESSERPDSSEWSESSEQTDDEDDRIATERNREDEGLRSHKRPSLWKRLFRR